MSNSTTVTKTPSPPPKPSMTSRLGTYAANKTVGVLTSAAKGITKAAYSQATAAAAEAVGDKIIQTLPQYEEKIANGMRSGISKLNNDQKSEIFNQWLRLHDVVKSEASKVGMSSKFAPPVPPAAAPKPSIFKNPFSSTKKAGVHRKRMNKTIRRNRK